MSQIFDMPQSVSKEVEDEANSYFQRIYNHPPHPTLSIEEVSFNMLFVQVIYDMIGCLKLMQLKGSVEEYVRNVE